MHDAFTLLQKHNAFPAQYINNWQPDKTDEVLSWLTQNSIVANPLDATAHLPVSPTRQNAELLRIFVELISRFKASLDGNPESTNAYTKFYVPFCIQTPMLAQISIYTSACLLHETGHLDKMTTMSYKGIAIHMLNEHLRCKGPTTDEAIAGVTQLIIDEWYWGDTDDLKAHLRGLREMIRLRGGSKNLGMNGLLAKLVIVSDIAIALSFETAPFLQDGPELEFHDTMQPPLRLALNTPLVSSLVQFSACEEALNLHPATAQILDDMRFLIGLVLALPQDSSEKDLQKVKTTSSWIHERISSLPPNSPSIQRPAVASPDLLRPGSAASPTFLFSGQTPTTVPATSRRNSRQPSSLQHQDVSGSYADNGVSAGDYFSSTAISQPVDVMYQAVRQAALIYARAIMLRKTFCDTIEKEDFLRLWTTIWRVSLSTWKALLGVFSWIVLCIVPCAKDRPHDRLVKSILTISLVQMGMENWEIADAAMKAGLRLQKWLAEGQENGEIGSDGEEGQRG